MKGFRYIVLVVIIGLGIVFLTGFSLKEKACKVSCEKAYQKCQEEAGDDALKKAACEKAYEECLEECKKKK
jgi:Cys-rich protein (TIGR04453 family)